MHYRIHSQASSMQLYNKGVRKEYDLNVQVVDKGKGDRV